MPYGERHQRAFALTIKAQGIINRLLERRTIAAPRPKYVRGEMRVLDTADNRQRAAATAILDRRIASVDVRKQRLSKFCRDQLRADTEAGLRTPEYLYALNGIR